jgi:hypothetical protein
MKSEDLYRHIRTTFTSSLGKVRSERLALERAAQVILDWKPALSREEARQAAMRVLGLTPVGDTDER